MDNEGCFLLVVVLVVAVFAIGGGLQGYDEGYHAAQQEAVDVGHAEWVATPNGKVEFQWKEPAR